VRVREREREREKERSSRRYFITHSKALAFCEKTFDIAFALPSQDAEGGEGLG